MCHGSAKIYEVHDLLRFHLSEITSQIGKTATRRRHPDFSLPFEIKLNYMSNLQSG